VENNGCLNACKFAFNHFVLIRSKRTLRLQECQELITAAGLSRKETDATSVARPIGNEHVEDEMELIEPGEQTENVKPIRSPKKTHWHLHNFCDPHELVSWVNKVRKLGTEALPVNRLSLVLAA